MLPSRYACCESLTVKVAGESLKGLPTSSVSKSPSVALRSRIAQRSEYGHLHNIQYIEPRVVILVMLVAMVTRVYSIMLLHTEPYLPVTALVTVAENCDPMHPREWPLCIALSTFTMLATKKRCKSVSRTTSEADWM
ncbi:hypothetical protein PMIN06_001747 [Paraphaeosphaeria minitans]